MLVASRVKDCSGNRNGMRADCFSVKPDPARWVSGFVFRVPGCLLSYMFMREDFFDVRGLGERHGNIEYGTKNVECRSND